MTSSCQATRLNRHLTRHFRISLLCIPAWATCDLAIRWHKNKVLASDWCPRQERKVKAIPYQEITFLSEFLALASEIVDASCRVDKVLPSKLMGKVFKVFNSSFGRCITEMNLISWIDFKGTVLLLRTIQKKIQTRWKPCKRGPPWLRHFTAFRHLEYL